MLQPEASPYRAPRRREPSGGPLGFPALCEGSALHAEGAFGIVSELYVRRSDRGQGLGG